MHTDSLSFKFYEDPFFGCREIAEINMSMHYSNFLKHVVMQTPKDIGGTVTIFKNVIFIA